MNKTRQRYSINNSSCDKFNCLFHTDGYIHREGGRNDTETGDSQIGKLHLTSMREIYTLRIIIFTQRRSKITRNHH